MQHIKIGFEKRKTIYNISPARVIAVSFAAVIMVGTILLMLPVASRDGKGTAFLESLFTATSATCVTGLVIYDTYTKWTIFGQVVILLLIQIGGLGLVTFTTFFNIAIGRKLGLKSIQLAGESVSNTEISDTTRLVKLVVAMSLMFELLGALLLSIRFVPQYGIEGAFTSVFISISAFCNAGFDLFGRIAPFSSLSAYNNDPLVILVIAALIIAGGLGFLAWYDIFNFKKRRKLMLHTKIVLSMTGILIVTGMVLFLITEWNNPMTLETMSFTDKLSATFFQSVTTRTAGFNTIDMPFMREQSKIIAIILMFIGAAPGSTGGGIKITTFAVIVMTVVSVIRGRDDTMILKRKVDKSVVYKALAIVCLAMLAILITTGIIYFTSSGMVQGIDAVFEAISAFSTVGLSVGATATVGVFSRVLLIITMFIGRVGPVSLALSLAMRGGHDKNEVIPEGKILVG